MSARSFRKPAIAANPKLYGAQISATDASRRRPARLLGENGERAQTRIHPSPQRFSRGLGERCFSREAIRWK